MYVEAKENKNSFKNVFSHPFICFKPHSAESSVPNRSSIYAMPSMFMLKWGPAMNWQPIQG